MMTDYTEHSHIQSTQNPAYGLLSTSHFAYHKIMSIMNYLV